jgi:hypothetical protein
MCDHPFFHLPVPWYGCGQKDLSAAGNSTGRIQGIPALAASAAPYDKGYDVFFCHNMFFFLFGTWLNLSKIPYPQPKMQPKKINRLGVYNLFCLL